MHAKKGTKINAEVNERALKNNWYAIGIKGTVDFNNYQFSLA